MRTLRLSETFNDQRNELLDYGESRLGTVVTERKKTTAYDTIERYVLRHPEAMRSTTDFGLRISPVTRTPFVVLYDFDDAKVRIHFIVHGSANWSVLDPKSTRW